MTDGFGSSDSEKKAEKQRILDNMKNNLAQKPSSFAGPEKASNPKVQEDAKWLDNEGKRLFKKPRDEKPMLGKSVGIKYRNPILAVLFTILTFGIYALYWIYKTKNEMNSLGAKIPNIILLFIPLIQLFFIYKYAEGYAKFVKKDNNTIVWLLLFVILSPVAVFLFQSELNNYSSNPFSPKTKKDKASKLAPAVGLAAATKTLDKNSKSGLGIMTKLKSIYYTMEDKYYEMLDKIDPVIPIYKVVDPIDKVFPSFILFLLLILLLLLLLIWLIFGGLSPPTEFAAGIKIVKDSPEQDGLADAHVVVEYESILLYDGYTGSDGKISEIQLASESISAYVTVSKSGYNDFQCEILLENGKTTKIQLTPMSNPDAQTHFKIYVEDFDTGQKLQGISVTMEFSCSNGAGAPARDTKDTGYFSVYVDKSACGTLTATVMATGYETLNSQRISNEITNLKLRSLSTESNIVVYVYDDEGDTVEDVAVRLYDEEIMGMPIKSGSTDSFGTYMFEDVEPGTYKVTGLHDDGRNAEKESIVVGSGVTIIATLTLGELPPGGSKKLLIKVIDGDNINEPDPIEDVKVLVYKNKSRIDTIYTDEDGIAEKPYDVNATDHMDLVLLHEDYLVKIHPGIQLVSANSNTPKEIKMLKISENDYATVNVEVLSYGSNEPVEDAEVYLYEADTNLMVHESTKYTDDEGLATFEYLPDSPYFAIAKDDFTGTEGRSETKSVLRGAEITLTINLVLGMGNFKVTIKDKETNLPIIHNGTPIVSVKQYDPVTDEITDTNKIYPADEYGVAVTDYFTIDKQYVLKISHDDYQTHFTEPLQAIDNTTVEPTPSTIALVPNELVLDTEISLTLDGIYTDDGPQQLATKVQSGETYYLHYKLQLPKEGTYTDISQYILVGSDIGINLSASGYVIKIKDVTASASSISGPANIILSNCYFDLDPYINPPGCTGDDVKKASIYWNELDGKSTYDVTAEVEIGTELEDGTSVFIKSQAKTTYNGSDYFSDKLSNTYIINETNIECIGPECPKFDYGFQMSGLNPDVINGFYDKEKINHYENEAYMPGPDGKFEDGAELPLMDEPLLVFAQEDYDFYYNVKNITKDETFNTTLLLDSDSMGLNYYTILIGNFAPNQILTNNNPLPLTPVGGDPGFMIFNILNNANPDEIYGKSIMFFKIINGNMEVDVQPNVITPNAYPTITVKVTGQLDSKPLQNAGIEIYLRRNRNSSILTRPLAIALTDRDGVHEFTPSDLSGALPEFGDVYLITVTKQGYLKQPVSISVGVPSIGTFNPAYGCISVEYNRQPVTDSTIIPVDKSGTQEKFTIKTTRTIGNVNITCNEPVDISFGTKLDIDNPTAKLDPIKHPQQEFTITVPSNVALGLYPIYVLGQFASDDQNFHADTIKTNITDESGSCLWKIEPLSYNFIDDDGNSLTYADNMTIHNQCPLSEGPENVFMPSLASDSAKIALDPGQKIPSRMKFNWTVKVNADGIQGELPLDSTIIFPGKESGIEKIYIGVVSVWDLMNSVGYPANINADNVTFTPVIKEITEVIPNKNLTEYCNTGTGTDCIDIWLEGKVNSPMLRVYASYRGKDTHRTGNIVSPVYNVDVRSNDYVMITARDYVREIR